MNNKRLITAILVVVGIGAVCYFVVKPAPKPAMEIEPGTVYYEGPTKGKNGTWGLPDGTAVPAPAGASSQPLPRDLEGETT
jgi:hypothetical protein